MAPFTIYTHAWPLFITVLPPSSDLHDIEVYIGEVNQLYKRRERFATLVDATPMASIPGATERRRLADWQNETVELIKRYNVFTATVLSSSMVRGALTAMNWVFRPPNEQVVVGTFEEGYVRCVDRLVAGGLTVPPPYGRMARESPPRRAEDTLPDRSSARMRKG